MDLMKPIVFAISLLMTLLLSACVGLNDSAMRLLATSSPAYAVLNGTAFEGSAQLYSDRSGKLDLQSEKEPLIQCMGDLRRTASRSGVISLHCNDGAEAYVNFKVLGEASGHGSGSTGRGMVSLTFGLSRSEAAAHLKLPASRPTEIVSESNPKAQ
jgi:hypothetical protein